jgi:hypothetical protein
MEAILYFTNILFSNYTNWGFVCCQTHWHNNEILTELEVFKSNQFCIFQAPNKPKTEKQKNRKRKKKTK